MKRFAISQLIRLLCSLALVTLGGMQSQSSTAKSAAATAPVPKGAGSLAGIWLNAQYKWTGRPARERAIRASDDSVAPLLPWAAALLEKRLQETEQGDIFANTLTECLPGGIPQMLFGATYPVQILETPGQVTMLFEEQNHFRVIVLNGNHPGDPDPGYMGHSIGHWERDTLVVDTIGLNKRTTLDMVGTPHTEALHVIERYRRIAADKLEVRVTLDDTGAFSRPWKAQTTYKAAPAGTHVSEYICENNRNAPDKNGHTTFRGGASN